MTDNTTISKNPALRTAEDYAALRELGMGHVQKLSGKIWTDHNLHDPGITTLEVLCYALTDLGYRTGFPVVDLLTRPDGKLDTPDVSGLFPAHEVLPACPLTISDWRRLLLRIENIRNAWFDPMMDPTQAGNYRESEIPFYADCLDGSLSFRRKNAAGKANERVRVSGLYRVRVELAVDDQLGALSDTELTYRVPRGALKGVVLALDSEHPDFLSGSLDLSLDFGQVAAVEQVEKNSNGFAARVRITMADSSEIVLEDLVVGVVDDRPEAGGPEVEVTEPRVEAVLDDSAADGLIALFWKKQQVRAEALRQVCCVLDAHRNLCEDFLAIEPVQADDITICVDIDVAPDADLEDVQARVFHAIEQYLNPPVHYYTLQELLDEGWSPDEIFNGPYVDFAFECDGVPVFTKPGFIKQEDLDASELRSVVYASDIINILMDLEDVEAVKHLMLRRIDASGNPVGPTEKWCLAILPGRQPVLDIDRSKVLFFKGEIPYAAQSSEFEETLDRLRAMAAKGAYVAPDQVLAEPEGRWRNLSQHYTVQNDYPRTYGIGAAGLPSTASDERVAQARQFKGYLALFDQLLADYLAQLAGARRLLSIDKTLEQTYFSQFVTDVPGVRGDYANVIYVQLPDVLSNDTRRTRLTEDEELYADRRNRFLDHLIARFSERFTDYAMMMFGIDGDPTRTSERLIEDKIDFLAEYPVVSRERYKAFNYRPSDPTDVWDSDNVSGLEKRVSRLLGIDDYTRRDLACAEVFDLLFGFEEVGGQFRIVVKESDGTVLFQPVETFATRSEAVDMARTIYPRVRDKETYVVDASGGTGTVTLTMKVGGDSLVHDGMFSTEADAVGAARAIVDRHDAILLSDACNLEGFHLIEHILLRPFTKQDELMDVCLDPNCDLCGEEDPYSFRVSVLVPYWPARFQSLEFRQFFERTLRQETPAHIHARICWISNQQMAELDWRLRAWLDARATKDVDETVVTDTAGPLIRLLHQLRNVNPAAVLHDCEDGDSSNPVRLGTTNLGIF